jgi:hypothetical protein
MMKKILVALSLLGALSMASAQGTCEAAAQSVNIFFDNGAAVSLESARTSLAQLRSAIGDSQNGQKITYSVAYNKSVGVAKLLITSSTQEGIEWNSQVMGWFNGVGVAPIWFSKWYQNYLLSATTVNVSDVSEHADQFSRAIVNGQKVMVVAHSQGNYYVNEAKSTMQKTLPSEKMQSFSVFGVGVPTSNVAGNSGPYLTNHRDFIQTVAGALPQNWTLRGSDVKATQDLDAVKAHSFTDTYMSTNFDARAAIVAGVTSKLGQTMQPARDCSIYRRAMLSMVEGSYATCKGPFIITQTGATGIHRKDFSIKYVELPLDEGLQLIGGGGDTLQLFALHPEYIFAYSWNKEGVFRETIPTTLVGCSDEDIANVPETKLKAPIEMTRTMMGLMDKKIQYFYNSCFIGGKRLTGLTVVEISGTTIKIGNSSWDFGSDLKFESVSTNPPPSTNKDPGFFFHNTDNSKRVLQMAYRNTTGLQSFVILDTTTPGPPNFGNVVACSLL